MERNIINPELSDLCSDFFSMGPYTIEQKLKEHGFQFGFSIEPKGRIAYFQKNYRGETDDLTKRVLLKTGKFCNFLYPECPNHLIQEFGDKLMQLSQYANLEIRITSNVGQLYEREHPDDESELGNSCMREKEYNWSLNDVCRAAYVDDENDDLIARALLWNLPNGEVYLDRIYAVNDALKKKIQDWGRNRGYHLYERHAPAENLVRKYGASEVTVPTNWCGDEEVPYMDTFCYMYKNGDGKLHLTPEMPDYDRYGVFGRLSETDGEFTIHVQGGNKWYRGSHNDIGMYRCENCDQSYEMMMEMYDPNGTGHGLCPDCAVDKLIDAYLAEGYYLRIDTYLHVYRIHTPFGVFGIDEDDIAHCQKVITCPKCNMLNSELDNCGKCGHVFVPTDCEDWEYTATYEKMGPRSYGRAQRRA